jgi:glycine cleavage system H protein
MLGRLPRPLQRKCGQRENKLMKYTEEHDWLRVEGELATEQLGDVVFVELPDPGTLVSRGDEIVVIESVKTASEISAMYDGEIVAVNEALVETPSLVNEDPTGTAWFFKIKLADMAVLDALMDEAAYKDMIA